MSIKATLSSCCVTAAVVTLTAAGSWAADTACTTITNGTGASKSVIAVASNFYGPAQDMVTAFQGTTSGANTAITVCQNSTAHLLAEIKNGTALPSSAFPADPGFPRYGLFMAANTSAPVSLQTSTGHTAYTYAYGIPVLFAPQSSINSVNGLISGLGGATAATITTAVTSSQAINTTNTQMVAVADPDAAPYGLAATTVLRDMGLIPTTSGFTVPSWMHSLYSNIDLTYASVGGTNKSGFVSKAQICDQINGTGTPVTYVAFTNKTAHYETVQGAILLKSATADPVASALNSFITGQMTDGSGDWNTFLTNHCYDEL